jgi:predicted acetyltransferase
VEIRSPTEDELGAVLAAQAAAFGEEPWEWYAKAAIELMPLDRVLVAFDGGRPVGSAASFPLRVSIPGGELPAGGVTWVAVLPSHRRRGLLREFMQRQLDDLRARGEPLALLTASEAPIYGRFGYGLAIPSHSIDATCAGFAFRDDPGPRGSMRIVSPEEAQELFPPLYERIRTQIPGTFARSDAWWREFRLADHGRPGWGPRFRAVLELDGRVAGYVVYRTKSGWEDGLPDGRVSVVELLGDDADAERELWRFLFSIDLVVAVESPFHDPGSPLFLQVVDPRRLRLRVADGVWLRLVDVDAALRARSYADGEPVVIEVRDDSLAHNNGRWRLGDGGAQQVDDEAELALDVRDVASVYFGGIPFEAVARAGRIDAHTEGAVERAAALLRTLRPPFCPEDF